MTSGYKEQLLLDIADNLIEKLERIAAQHPNAPIGMETVNILDGLLQEAKDLDPEQSIILRMKPLKPGMPVIDACLRASVLRIVLIARFRKISSKKCEEAGAAIGANG